MMTTTTTELLLLNAVLGALGLVRVLTRCAAAGIEGPALNASVPVRPVLVARLYVAGDVKP
eukprot:1173802-Prymnesium_polylepis.1